MPSCKERKDTVITVIYVCQILSATISGPLPPCVQIIAFIAVREPRRMWGPVRDETPTSQPSVERLELRDTQERGAFQSNSIGFLEIPQ